MAAALLASATPAEASKVLRLNSGPQLLIDDYLIADSAGVRRSVERLRPFDAPIVSGIEDGNSTPYVSVVRDAGGYRLWYDRAGNEPGPLHSHIGLLTSRDGLTWRRPALELVDPAPITFGVSVFAGGRRLAWWYDGAMWLARSADGEHWMGARPVLSRVGDIVSVARDLTRGRWLATFKLTTVVNEADPSYRRLVGISTSRDLAIGRSRA
jgi:hypothetical protein